VRIAAAAARAVHLPLTRPYTIATAARVQGTGAVTRTISAVETMLVELRDGAGRVGLGTATPEVHVTGETFDRCRAALAPGALEFLVGADLATLPALLAELAARLPGTPAARAAVDMALHDLLGHALGVSLGVLLGRSHEALPTSITIGIKETDQAVAEAEEYLGRGFNVLKIKIGRSLDEDLDRLTRLRERLGPHVVLRADANQGYSRAETERFFAAVEPLQIEFLEQPIRAAAIDELRPLPATVRARIAADESLLAPADALRLAAPPHPAGIFNIKLMKCGGVGPARTISAIAEAAGLRLMWGCMDESCIGISAALHAALASPATRYLDLDGSFDLARDIAEGGFTLDQGRLRPTGGPGLGVRLRD
jgi:L-alanine-DL-glutamate epimerase-like enolase superfamily enzyme